MSREVGFYWVREAGIGGRSDWLVAYWNGTGWQFIGDDGTANEPPLEVDERKLVRPV